MLDLAKDWRFSKNNFGQYTGGFYVNILSFVSVVALC